MDLSSGENQVTQSTVPSIPGDQPIMAFLKKNDEEILTQIRKIYSDQEGGYWPVSSGDLIFIYYLEEVDKVIQEALSRGKMNHWRCLRLIRKLKKIHLALDSKPLPKIKIVFFLQEIFVWPSFESVYEAFRADPECEAHLVYVPFAHVNKQIEDDDMKAYKAAGFPVIHCNEYDLAAESPDIVFYVKPYDSIPKQFYIDDVEKIVKRAVFIPYGVKWVNHDNLPLLVRYHFQLPLQEKAWKIFDTPPDIRKKYNVYAKRHGENLETVGHPRFDSVHKLPSLKIKIPEIWKTKIAGRKVFLWNTHFINRTKGNADSVWATYESFGEKILSHFLTDKSLVLLWRPHPYFLSGLVNSEIMTEKELAEMKVMIEKSDNIILDTLGDYRYAFSVADALITDASGLLSEFLEVDKPILYTFNKGQPAFVMDKLLPAFYQAYTWDAIKTFVELVKAGNDTKKKYRQEVREFLGINPGMNVGERVKEICVRDLQKEETAKGRTI